MSGMSPELLAIVGVALVHLLPKLLQRARIPAPVSALLLGVGVAAAMPELAEDPTVSLLSTMGIAALFLFAGLEVDAEDLGRAPALLVGGLFAQTFALGLATCFGVFGLHLDVAPAMILGLGIVTPSGGFILDGLHSLGGEPAEKPKVRDAALVAELLALVVFFGVTQSTSLGAMVGSLAVMVAMLLLLPVLLRGFARRILPFAPNSEFPMLVLTAVVCAYTTRKLGVYYLVGAFVVGVVARRLKDEVPALASEKNLTAIELFAAFFAPFYFTRAGMLFDPGNVGWKAIGLGVVLLVFATPARIALVAVVRHLATGAPLRAELRIATAIVPTFVFSLVMASVLEQHASAPDFVQGGLLVYAVLNAFVPTAVFSRLPAPEPTPEPLPDPPVQTPDSPPVEPAGATTTEAAETSPPTEAPPDAPTTPRNADA